MANEFSSHKVCEGEGRLPLAEVVSVGEMFHRGVAISHGRLGKMGDLVTRCGHREERRGMDILLQTHTYSLIHTHTYSHTHTHSLTPHYMYVITSTYTTYVCIIMHNELMGGWVDG